MKRLVAATLAAGVCVGSSAGAFAADLRPAPVYLKAPPVRYTWAGFYGGANGGWVGSAGNTITLTGTDTGTAGLGSMLANGVIPGSLNLDIAVSSAAARSAIIGNPATGSWVLRATSTGSALRAAPFFLTAFFLLLFKD